MSSQILDKLDARECASLFKTDSVDHQVPQSVERISILKAWLQPDEQNAYAGFDLSGRQILELGCGQGDCTTVIGKALQLAGDSKGKSRVYGVDPGRPDYGAPYTLKQAQEFISEGPLKDIVSFEFATGPDFLDAQQGKLPAPIDTLVMTHCLYYFPSQETLREVFESCAKHGVKHLLLAEWSLRASRLEAVPHVLAVLAQDFYPMPEGNVRTVFTPETAVEMAAAAGYAVLNERDITDVDMQDGRWEYDIATHHVQDTIAKREPGQERRDQSLKTHIEAMRAAVRAKPGASHKDMRNSVKAMDVWTGVFELKG